MGIRRVRALLGLTLVIAGLSIEAMAGVQFRAPKPHFHANVEPGQRFGNYKSYYESFKEQTKFFDELKRTNPERYERVKDLQRYNEQIVEKDAQIRAATDERARNILLKEAEELAIQRHEALKKDFIDRLADFGVTPTQRDGETFYSVLAGAGGAEVGGVGKTDSVRSGPEGDHGSGSASRSSSRPTADEAMRFRDALGPALEPLKNAFDNSPGVQALQPNVRRKLWSQLSSTLAEYFKDRVEMAKQPNGLAKGMPGADDPLVKGLSDYVKENMQTPEDALAVSNFLKSLVKRNPQAPSDLIAEVARTEGYFKAPKERRKAIIAGAGRLTGMRLKLMGEHTINGVKVNLTPEQVSKKLGEWIFAGEDFRKALEIDPEGKLFNEWITDKFSSENKKWADQIRARADEGLCQTLKRCHGSMGIKCAV